MQTDPIEMRSQDLMLASLDRDAAAYRTLLAELGRHLHPYFTRRLTPCLCLARGGSCARNTARYPCPPPGHPADRTAR